MTLLAGLLRLGWALSRWTRRRDGGGWLLRLRVLALLLRHRQDVLLRLLAWDLLLDGGVGLFRFHFYF